MERVALLCRGGLLLIEPCGIEIADGVLRQDVVLLLLIEPCGIEMEWQVSEYICYETF